MKSINVTQEMTVLPLGRVGENGRTQFVFDVSDTLEEYPGAEIVLLNQKPKSYDVYECELSAPEEGKVTWTITSDELTAEGTGCCQLVATKDTVIARTKTWDTTGEKGLIRTIDPEEEEEEEEPQEEET